MSEDFRDLAAALAKRPEDSPLRRRVGQVTAVSTAHTCTVVIGGDTVGVDGVRWFLGQPEPAVDDLVQLIVDGPDLFIIGILSVPTQWPTTTPTLTNITIGTGTTRNQQAYLIEGNRVTVQGSILLGTGGQLNGDPTVTIPRACVTRTGFVTVGSWRGQNVNIKIYPGSSCIASGASVVTFVHGAGGGTGNLGTTLPFTWGPGDSMEYAIVYEKA